MSSTRSPELFQYTTWGAACGGCGHRHRTERTAVKCWDRARSAFRAQGMEWDRSVYTLVRGEDLPDEYDYRKRVLGAVTLQETLLHEEDGEWKLLVGCVLLNRTSGRQVDRVIWKVLEEYPRPEFLAYAGRDLEATIQPTGLWRQKAETLRRLSSWWFRSGWDRRKRWLPTAERLAEVRGLGKYAVDSYRLFVLGDRSIKPDDPVLEAALRRGRLGGSNPV